MKENAPEKIFLEWYKIGDKKYRDWCIIPKTNDEPVEYVRKDVFIKKLKCWLNEKGRNYCGEFNEGFLIEFMTSEEAIEDFKNYMKGE